MSIRAGLGAGRSPDDYLDLHRSQAQNHLRTETNKSAGKSKLHQLADFLTKRVWSWFYYYLVNRFGPLPAYPDYGLTEDKGVYTLTADPGSPHDYISIALAADWATDTPESAEIARRIGEHTPDYTIHLGDAYFVGAPAEIAANFTAPGAPWVRGRAGSFAVLGNHEMYARGISFFKDLLPTLGLKVGLSYQGQHAGYCCLENAHWRILALDTGYHSIGRIPLVEMIPFLAPDAHLDPALLDWLQHTVKIGDPADKRGLLILTHHQYISSFNETEYQQPALELARFIGSERPVLWIWGHEHKFALYEKTRVGGGVTAYGRCIGNGGMPVELKTFGRNTGKKGYPKLVMYDHRPRASLGSNDLGYNGYVVLKIRQAELAVEYYDNERYLFTETWDALGDGTIKGRITVPADCPLFPIEGKNWENAVMPNI